MTTDRLWFVIDTITGIRFEPGHDTYAEAMTVCVARTVDCDDDIPGRYDVQQEAATPWAYAVPVQGHSR